MAKKKTTKGDSITNRPLQEFLLRLSVEDDLRAEYNKAGTADEKKAFLKARPEKMGIKTINALVSGDPGRVEARFGFSDQQGTPPSAARKAASTSKKR